jgi:creatinine amidohydrolase/Fe(II)-dependent formamide hydrolase-like protein
MPLRSLVIAVALFLAATSAALSGASPAPEVEIERLTSDEIGRRIAAGSETLIVPTGGTESNGHHMVTGKHNFIVAETARRIARSLGNALVAPVIAYVPEGDIEARTGHMEFPGTLSVPESVFAAVLEAAAASGKAHGFETIVFLGDSGGNQDPQQKVAERLSVQWAADGVTVVNAGAYYSGNGGEAWLEAEGETAATIGHHAGIRDTSELLAVYPEGVFLDRVEGDGSDGASGQAARASRARGGHLLNLKVAAAVTEIREAQQLARERAEMRSHGLFARLYRLIFG